MLLVVETIAIVEDGSSIDSFKMEEDTHKPKIPYLELLKIAFDSAEKEADRLWSRFRVLLLTNGALAAALTVGVADPVLQLTVASCGFVLCVLWFHITRLSVYYYRRWFRDTKFIVEKCKWEHLLATRINDREGVCRPWPGGSSKDCLYGIIILFAAVWIALAVNAAIDVNW